MAARGNQTGPRLRQTPSDCRSLGHDRFQASLILCPSMVAFLPYSRPFRLSPNFLFPSSNLPFLHRLPLYHRQSLSHHLFRCPFQLLSSLPLPLPLPPSSIRLIIQRTSRILPPVLRLTSPNKIHQRPTTGFIALPRLRHLLTTVGCLLVVAR